MPAKLQAVEPATRGVGGEWQGGFGEFALAVRSASSNRIDPRLKRSAAGLNSDYGSEGAFLVPDQFRPELLMRIYEKSLASMCSVVPMTSNELTMAAIDEASRADGSRFGGARAYWKTAEGYEPTKSKPKIAQLKFVADTLIAECWITGELPADAPTLGANLTRVFSSEIAFRLDDAIVNGSGAGTPVGILNSPALITVAKESGQDAGTIVYENVVNMWARLFGASRKTAVWLVNQNADPQLLKMSNKIQNAAGTDFVGGGPVYLAEGTPETHPYPALFGRPVIPVENCSTVGVFGDIILAALDQYMLADRGMRVSSSIHIGFSTDEVCFKFVQRITGQPLWKNPVIPKNGTDTPLSPFVALATRS